MGHNLPLPQLSARCANHICIGDLAGDGTKSRRSASGGDRCDLMDPAMRSETLVQEIGQSSVPLIERALRYGVPVAAFARVLQLRLALYFIDHLSTTQNASTMT